MSPSRCKPASPIPYRRLVDALPQPVWLVRGDGSIEYGNPSWRRLVGRGRHAVSDWLSLVHEDDRARAAQACCAALAGTPQAAFASRLKCRDGQHRGYLVSLQPIDAAPRAPAQAHTRALATAREVDAASGEPHAADLSGDELRAYVRYVDSAIEQERAHIARELHDELGQSLTALKFDLRWLAAQFTGHAATPAAWSRRLDGMNELVDRTIGEVRALSSELRPQAIETLGLAAAIEDFCRQFGARTGIACTLELQPHKYVRPAQKLAVFRVFQEAMTNVARHSAARHVTVRLFARDRSVCLEVEDDGDGLPAPGSQRQQLGILGMRERAHNMAGTLDISTAAGRGVRVVLTLPLAT